MKPKSLLSTYVFSFIIIISVIQISSCTKEEPSTIGTTPATPPKEYTLDLNYFGSFNIEYNVNYVNFFADHCSSKNFALTDVVISGNSFKADITLNQRYFLSQSKESTEMLLADNLGDYMIFSDFTVIFSLLKYTSGVSVFDGTCVITEGAGKFKKAAIFTTPLKFTGTADTLHNNLKFHLTGKVYY
jgi:hypothetical protein